MVNPYAYAVEPYNTHLANLTKGVFGHFGIAGMLERRAPEPA